MRSFSELLDDPAINEENSKTQVDMRIKAGVIQLHLSILATYTDALNKTTDGELQEAFKQTIAKTDKRMNELLNI